MQMPIGQEPIGRLDVMLLVRGAGAVSPQLSQRELAAGEQSVHQFQ
jgi:hypothetical protein